MRRRPAARPNLAPDPDLGEAPTTTEENGGSLLRSTGWLVGSRLIQAALGWGGTVLIARTLDVDEFGRFTLIFAVLGLMSIVTDMGIGRIAVRGMLGGTDRDPGSFAGAYIVLRTLLGLLGYALVIGFVIALGYPGEVVTATAVAGVVIVLATPSSALDVVFQARLRMSAVSVAGVLGTVAQFALIAAIAAQGGSLLYFTIPAVLSEVVVLLVKVPRARRLVPIRLNIDRALWRGMLREAIPLTLGVGLATVYYRVDSVMLSRLDDFDAVGIYGISYKFVDVLHFAVTAVTVPLMTLLVRAWPDDLEGFRDAVRRAATLMGLIAGLAVVGLVGFPAQVTSLLYGAPYAVGADATRLLILTEVLTLFASLILTCLIAIDRHRRYPLVMLLGLLLNIGANLVLIPRYSFHGAAAASLGAEIVVITLLWSLLSRERSLRPFGLKRLSVVPLALAVALPVGWATDLVVPWAVAATAASLTYLTIAAAGGLVAAAGIPLPGRRRR